MNVGNFVCPVAYDLGKDLRTMQYHYAHILLCMAEHYLQAPALGIAWDGTGYGTGNTIWGGEFLQVTKQASVRATSSEFERVAHFLPYYLPGAEACSLEPRCSALGLLYSCYGEAAFEMTDMPKTLEMQ